MGSSYASEGLNQASSALRQASWGQALPAALTRARDLKREPRRLKPGTKGLKLGLGGSCQPLGGQIQVWGDSSQPLGSKRAGKWMDGRMDIRDERMDRWKDRNSPNVLQDFIPFGAAALLPFITSIRGYNRQTHVPIFDFYTLLNTFFDFKKN